MEESREIATETERAGCAICGAEPYDEDYPYCWRHEYRYGDEWAPCGEYGCDRPSPYPLHQCCSLHGGADYVPHTKEPDEPSTEPPPSTTHETRAQRIAHAPGQHDGGVPADSREGSDVDAASRPCPRCGPVRVLCEFPPTCFRPVSPGASYCEIHKCITPGCSSKRERAFHHCEQHPAE